MSFISLPLTLEKAFKKWIYGNINPYASEIMEACKDTIIGYLGKSSTTDLLLHIIQYCHKCLVD